MARKVDNRDIEPTLEAATRWIHNCLIEDSSVLSERSLWSVENVKAVRDAFVEHPDLGADSFIIKLTGQISALDSICKQLTAEMLWALLLFPSNIKPDTKRKQISTFWALSGSELNLQTPMLSDAVLAGIGSGGTGFNNYRPDELAFLLTLTLDLKQKPKTERNAILTDYDRFVTWIDTIQRRGNRQFRHMLRYFAFPDKVERMSSNNDRVQILKSFKVDVLDSWSDRQLDEALLDVRRKLTVQYPSMIDFYEPAIKPLWSKNSEVATPDGPIVVTVPSDTDETTATSATDQRTDVRESFRVQGTLVEIGSIMGFKVWLPPSDRVRISDVIDNTARAALLETLPLNYDGTTIDTIKQIDVLWIRGRSIVRAFEVEHTTSVYSGLLRMADLLALQPNMSIKLHIVASAERREKVFSEMRRPVFSLLDRGPLANTCTFLSYDKVREIRKQRFLANMNPGIIDQFAEAVDD